MDLKNINIDDLKEKFLKIDRKILIKLGIGFGAFILLLILYFTIVKPIINKKERIYKAQTVKLNEISKFKKNIKSYKKEIKHLTPDYKNNSSLFHSKEEVEDLYNTLSVFATANNLEILKIEKKTPVQIFTSKQKKKKKKKKKKKNKSLKKAESDSYYKIPVSYEIYGNFLDFIKFKRAIAKSKQMLKFEKELFTTSKRQIGKINIVGQLTIVGLPNEFN